MNDLILPQKPKGFKKMSAVFGNGKNTNSRNSRDVHKYMNVKTDYSDWIKRRIDALGAEENIDFTVLKNGDGKFTKIDYIITDDFAKHLGMVEKNSKGKDVRDYFIFMERFAKYLLEKHILDCEVKTAKVLESKDNEIKQLQVKRMKTYKEGFMSLGKYLKENNIVMTKETAFAMLSKYDIIEHRDVLTSKIFLLDDSFGRQTGDSVIEFNSRSLDLIFRDYVRIEPSLF